MFFLTDNDNVDAHVTYQIKVNETVCWHFLEKIKKQNIQFKRYAIYMFFFLFVVNKCQYVYFLTSKQVEELFHVWEFDTLRFYVVSEEKRKKTFI